MTTTLTSSSYPTLTGVLQKVTTTDITPTSNLPAVTGYGIPPTVGEDPDHFYMNRDALLVCEGPYVADCYMFNAVDSCSKSASIDGKGKQLNVTLAVKFWSADKMVNRIHTFSVGWLYTCTLFK